MTKPDRTIPKESICHSDPELSHRKIKTYDVVNEKLHGFNLHGYCQWKNYEGLELTEKEGAVHTVCLV